MNDPLIKDHDENGPIRYMSSAEVKEREALNIANTASALRARVIAELAKGNGGSGNNGHSTNK